MNLVEKMFELEPERNPIFTAIENLKTTEEVKQFRSELITWYESKGWTQDNPECNGKTPEELADHNIGYIIGYYGKEERVLWYDTLKIGHPLLGRMQDDSSISEQEKVETAFREGMKAGMEAKMDDDT
jgi:hypothetical protein